MIIEHVLNSYLRVWFLTPDHKTRYCMGTGIYRVMFDGKKAKVMLKEEVTALYADLRDVFVDGTQIVVMYASVGRPDDFDNGKPYMIFTNCKLVRSWIPNLVPTRSKDVQPVTHFIEVESTSYSWNKDIVETE